MQVAKALFLKGIRHGRRDESEAELAAYDDLVARFGASDTPELQVQVAMALALTRASRTTGATSPRRQLAAYDDLVARFGASDTPELQVQVAKALVNKGITHGRARRV